MYLISPYTNLLRKKYTNFTLNVNVYLKLIEHL